MADVDQHFTTLLHKIAKEQQFINYDLKIQPISSGGANYTSNLYSVTITEGPNVLNLFAKVAAIGEKMRSQGPRFYETEYYVYNKLAKIYEGLQEKHEVPEDLKLCLPKYYGCNPKEFEETIVLENLVNAGYDSYDRFKSIDWPYASSAVEELAKLHALSFAFEHYKPEEYKATTEKLKFEWKMDEPAMKGYFDQMVEKCMFVVHQENKDKMKRFFEKLAQEDYPALYKASFREVLGHGDYRPSNLMHKKLDDGTVDIKIIDLQTLQGASPITDLLYFIFSGSDEQFRGQYYDQLIDHYYTQLSAALRRLHVNPEDVYSRDNYDQELKQKLSFGLTLAVFTLPVVTVEAEHAPKVNEDLDLGSFSVEKTSDLYAERLNGVVNDFVKWGVLT